MSKEKAKSLFSFISEKIPKLLDGDSIKWNFTKFLIDRNGNVVDRFEPPVTPSEIEKLLQVRKFNNPKIKEQEPPSSCSFIL